MRNGIRELRQELGLSQSQLAEACEVSRLTILSVELDRSDPSLTLAFRIARRLGVPVEQLFHFDDDR